MYGLISANGGKISRILNEILTLERLADIIEGIRELHGKWYIRQERRRELLATGIGNVGKRRDDLFETLGPEKVWQNWRRK
jgi:hypothetical protein